MITNLYVLAASSASGPPKNLVTSDITDTSFTASWTAAPGNVKMYQVKWKSMFSEENGEMMVPGDITNAVLKGLSPETLFQISVVANYGDRDSEALTGRETTDGITSNLSHCHLKLNLLKISFSSYFHSAVNARQRSKVKEKKMAFCVCPVTFFSLMFHLIC